MSTYIGFVPARGGSERVTDKNTRPFAGFSGGLLELKLKQLSRVRRLERIVVSSNSPEILEFAQRFAKKNDGRVCPVERPDQFGTAVTSMERFIRDYIAHLDETGTVVWTHVTHPFATSNLYDDALDTYEAKKSEGYDSLVSATKIQKFLWRDGKPFNYDNSAERWPRSQDLEPVWEINHALYIMPFALMRALGDRIGPNTYFFSTPESVAMDIDWEDQFHLMNEIATARRARGHSLI